MDCRQARRVRLPSRVLTARTPYCVGIRPNPVTTITRLIFVGIERDQLQESGTHFETKGGQSCTISGSMIMVAVAAAAGVILACMDRTSAQTPAGSATVPAPTPALKTPWGEPDLQGIWTDEFDTPLQRPAKYAYQQFFTEEQRAELDKERTEVLNRRAVGTPNDAYNFAVFLTTKRTGARTSKVVACLPISASGTATRVAIGRAIRSSLT
jgi:hypothetical protein